MIEAYQVNTHAEAPLGLVLSDLLAAVEEIPHIDPAVMRCPSQILSIYRQTYCPQLACLLCSSYLPIWLPASFSKLPDLCLASKAYADSSITGLVRSNVMASEAMSSLENLSYGEVIGASGVDLDGGIAGR